MHRSIARHDSLGKHIFFNRKLPIDLCDRSICNCNYYRAACSSATCIFHFRHSTSTPLQLPLKLQTSLSNPWRYFLSSYLIYTILSQIHQTQKRHLTFLSTRCIPMDSPETSNSIFLVATDSAIKNRNCARSTHREPLARPT